MVKTVFTVFNQAFSRPQTMQLNIAFNLFKNQMFYSLVLFVLFPTGVTLTYVTVRFRSNKNGSFISYSSSKRIAPFSLKFEPKDDYGFQSLSNLVGRQAFVLFRWINRCQRQTKLLTLLYTKLVLLFFFLIIICEVTTQRCVVFRLQSFAFLVRCRLLHLRRIDLL